MINKIHTPLSSPSLQAGGRTGVSHTNMHIHAHVHMCINAHTTHMYAHN